MLASQLTRKGLMTTKYVRSPHTFYSQLCNFIAHMKKDLHIRKVIGNKTSHHQSKNIGIQHRGSERWH